MFSGKNLVRNYKNHFGVDEVCALLELKALGKQIDASRIDKAQKAANQRGEAKILNRLAREPKLNQYPDSDQHHYYVAGHTSSGFAYGITWEQAETDGLYCP